MANAEHLAILRKGVEVWNKWREDDIDLRPDLSEIDLSGKILNEANFANTNLHKTNLERSDLSYATFDQSVISEGKLDGAELLHASFAFAVLNRTHLAGANLHRADFQDADLSGADLHNSQMSESNFSGANLRKANLRNVGLFWAHLEGVDLREADLSYADLHETNLSSAILVNTNLSNANLTGCNVYGISVWDIQTEGTRQSDLVITKDHEPVIKIDNLEVAQFIYMIIHNAKLREVIDTLATKAVLILGRFTEERLKILVSMQDELRNSGYIPILFNFDQPESRDLTETVITLAGLSRFVIADLSDPNSIPHELASFAEKFLSVPIMPVFCPTRQHPNPYPMLEHLQRYPHVLPTHFYKTEKQLIASFAAKVIEPAETRVKELKPR